MATTATASPVAAMTRRTVAGSEREQPYDHEVRTVRGALRGAAVVHGARSQTSANCLGGSMDAKLVSRNENVVALVAAAAAAS